MSSSPTGGGTAPAHGASPAGSGGDQERAFGYTTPEQFQRNFAMAKGWYKQSHAMHRASVAGVDPYTAIEQRMAVSPMFPSLPDGMKAQYELERDYMPGEGYYTAPGEMPAGSPASLTRSQLVEVSGPSDGSAQVCINGRYYSAAPQPAAHQSSAEGELRQAEEAATRPGTTSADGDPGQARQDAKSARREAEDGQKRS